MPFLPCPLVDAIEHVEKPKLRKITQYGYVSLLGFLWSCRVDAGGLKALDENGTWITKDVWVEDK